jgi:hypothetical protein
MRSRDCFFVRMAIWCQTRITANEQVPVPSTGRDTAARAYGPSRSCRRVHVLKKIPSQPVRVQHGLMTTGAEQCL